MFPLNLVKIGQIVKKWQQFIKIQEGGGRHLELWVLSLFDVVRVFYIKVAILLLKLSMIGKIVDKWQSFFEIQDGDDRHLEFVQHTFPTSSMCSEWWSQCFH